MCAAVGHYYPGVKLREDMFGLNNSESDSATEGVVLMVCVQLVKTIMILPMGSQKKRNFLVSGIGHTDQWKSQPLK